MKVKNISFSVGTTVNMIPELKPLHNLNFITKTKCNNDNMFKHNHSNELGRKQTTNPLGIEQKKSTTKILRPHGQS